MVLVQLYRACPYLYEVLLSTAPDHHSSHEQMGWRYITSRTRLDEIMHVKFPQCLTQHMLNSSTLFCQGALSPSFPSMVHLLNHHLQAFHGPSFSEFLKYNVPQNLIMVLFKFSLTGLYYWSALKASWGPFPSWLLTDYPCSPSPCLL